MSNEGESDSDSPRLEDLMIKGIRTLWEDNLYMDYTIEVEGQRFHVHKIALAAGSKFFRDRFTGNSTKSQETCIKFEDLTATAIEQLIKFIYTDKIDIAMGNLEQILPAAIHLQIPTAIEACNRFIYKNININNWLGILSFCRKLKHWKGIQEVKEHIDVEMSNILKEIDICQLSYDDFKIFVDCWHTSEYDLFCLINKWVKSDIEQRKRQHLNLLQKVRYPLMSPDELKSIKGMKMFQEPSGPWCDLVNKALRYHALPVAKKVLEKSSQSSVRAQNTVVVFPRANIDQVGCCYDIDRHCFVEHPGLKMPEGTGLVHAETVINNFLIVCAKINGQEDDAESPQQQWHIFNPRTMQWSQMTNLTRFFLRGVLVNDEKYIYAVGGAQDPTKNSKTFSSIERYSFKSEKWTPFAEMQFAEKDHSACVLDGKLYISGGVLHDSLPQDSLHSITLSTRNWKTKAPMLEPRHNHDMYVMTICGGRVLGIFDNRFRLEYYSPGKDQWTYCAFTFDAYFPLQCDVGVVLCGENEVSLVDINLKEYVEEERFEFIVLYFDGKSTNVTVSWPEAYKQRLADPSRTHVTLLAIPSVLDTENIKASTSDEE